MLQIGEKIKVIAGEENNGKKIIVEIEITQIEGNTIFGRDEDWFEYEIEKDQIIE